MPVDYEALERELIVATTLAFQRVQNAARGEQLYVFGLYTSGDGSYLISTANSEEALEAQLAVTGAEASVLRWSPCDWAYHGVAEEVFGRVQKVLDEGWSPDFSETSVDPNRVFGVALSVLRQLSRSRVFAVVPARSRLTINLFKGDQTDAERSAWAALIEA